MSKLLNVLSDKLSGKNVRIVLPEGDDARVLTAAVKLQTTDLVSPIVLGNEDKIKEDESSQPSNIAPVFLSNLILLIYPAAPYEVALV